MRVRLIEVDYPSDPHMNLALDEAIFLEVVNGRSPPTFRFYRNDNAVIIGCFQLASEEVDIDYAIHHDIKIAKRFTGGGAVYHDMGNINYSIIAKDSFGIGMNVGKLFSTMMGGAVDSLRNLGIDAAVGGLNDVSVNGKKILGSAATIRSDSILFHAAVLVDTDLDVMSSVLRVPGAKLIDKGATKISDRVSNIYGISGKDMKSVKDAILEGYSKALGFRYYVDELTANEETLLRKLHREKYTRSEWNLEREFINIEANRVG